MRAAGRAGSPSCRPGGRGAAGPAGPRRWGLAWAADWQARRVGRDRGRECCTGAGESQGRCVEAGPAGSVRLQGLSCRGRATSGPCWVPAGVGYRIYSARRGSDRESLVQTRRGRSGGAGAGPAGRRCSRARGEAPGAGVSAGLTGATGPGTGVLHRRRGGSGPVRCGGTGGAGTNVFGVGTKPRPVGGVHGSASIVPRGKCRGAQTSEVPGQT